MHQCGLLVVLFLLASALGLRTFVRAQLPKLLQALHPAFSFAQQRSGPQHGAFVLLDGLALQPDRVG